MLCISTSEQVLYILLASQNIFFGILRCFYIFSVKRRKHTKKGKQILKTHSTSMRLDSNIESKSLN